MSTTRYYDLVESPIGTLCLSSDGESLVGIDMLDPGDEHRPRNTAGVTLVRASLPFGAAKEQFAAYFAGDLARFELPLAPRGTDFQIRVWGGLLSIPYGQTISYAELARRIGDPRAVRAVGAANGRNPLPIVIPCHRVIGADGALTGYGGGLSRKSALLELEGAIARLPV